MRRLQNVCLTVAVTALVVSYAAWSSLTATTTLGTSSSASRQPIGDLREHSTVCHASLQDQRTFLPSNNDSSLPTIFFITPTYPRREQFAELTRLGQTLMHVPSLHWIVADDNPACNPFLTEIFQKFGLPFTHISSPMPSNYRKRYFVPRGVSNRRAALKWIKANAASGVFYFGDDDNTFDLTLFSEIRDTKIVSMFPVGLIGEFGVSAPIIEDGKVVGFFDSWPADRKFPVDMAGFAVSVEYLLQHPNATMPYKAGHEEDQFLKSLDLKMSDIEPKANNCTKVLVWHTQTVKKPKHNLKVPESIFSNLRTLLEKLVSLGVVQMGAEVSGKEVYMVVDGHKNEVTKRQVLGLS
ncbi:galactosylgalactosylxylosylprotein 3-beta-glucuronosyltransferase S [Cloeon dipterum]|uniref:galactosylgalactosylxylosylprotein 3-beta-glucuronosyltransferase S n=1 Tax=Cloeon dipterum TaxID=197152 RepID=UPI0032207BA3